MNWEDTGHGLKYSNAEPPTPIKTPTSTSYDPPPFNAPRVNEHFVDPRVNWDTANPLTDGQSPAQSNSLSGQVPTARTVNPRLSTREIDAQIASHVHHFAPSSLATFPPVETARRLTSSPAQKAAGNLDLEEQTGGRIVSQSTTFSPPLSMQTPPPSANSHSKQHYRELTQPISTSMADPQKQLTPNLSRMRPSQTPGRPINASPQLFTNLQFSPDLFSIPMSAPVTGAGLPQSRLFWDSESTNAYGQGDISAPLPNSFFPNQLDAAGHPVSPFDPRHAFDAAPTLHPSSAVELRHPQDDAFSSYSSPSQLEGAAFPAPFQASPRVPISRPEDPSMFLSSPARRFGPPAQTSTSLGAIKPASQPYHHQIEESKRDQEYERFKKGSNRRITDGKAGRRSSPVSSTSRPGITRSVTHTGIGDQGHHVRQQTQGSFAGPISSRAPLRTGRVSPLKRNSQQAGLDRPLSRMRGSLALEVDENGRAKLVPASGVVDVNMEMDGDASESGESMDSADFQIAHSQNASFAFSEDQNMRPNSAYLMPESRSHSKNSSYSSARGSSASTNQSSYNSSISGTIKKYSRTSNMPQPPISRHQHHSQRGSPSSAFLSSGAGSVAGREEDDGDALQAVRAVKQDRVRKSLGGNVSSTYRENSIQSFNSSPPIQTNDFDTFFQQTNISPTTITDPDLATPSTDRDSGFNGSVHCYCRSSGIWGPMIQCESCLNLLHMRCVRLDPARKPPVFICDYCNQTPARHGRLREPSRAAALAPTSPLAHKSTRFKR